MHQRRAKVQACLRPWRLLTISDQLTRIKHPDIAFVIVSGYDDFSYCREALRLQITDYILKPVNYEEFGR